MRGRFYALDRVAHASPCHSQRTSQFEALTLTISRSSVKLLSIATECVLTIVIPPLNLPCFV